MKIIDRLIGIYHFLGDRVPGNLPMVEPRKRGNNPWMKDGKVLVARVQAGSSLRDSVEKVLAWLGGVDRVIKRGDRVFLKPNFNSGDPYPATTDIEFLETVITLLKEAGARIILGESAGGVWRPTRNIFRLKNLYELAGRTEIGLLALEDRPEDWVRIRIEGQFFQTLTMPRPAYEADRLVYLPCLKTHFLAAYSGAIKLAMGFLHPGNRRRIHTGNLQRKLAEINLCWQPDLILMDGRKAFVTGGPSKGTVVDPGLLLASGDQVAIDVEGLRVLSKYSARNRLPADPWKLPQITAARELGLGPVKEEYLVVGDSLDEVSPKVT